MRDGCDANDATKKNVLSDFFPSSREDTVNESTVRVDANANAYAYRESARKEVPNGEVEKIRFIVVVSLL